MLYNLYNSLSSSPRCLVSLEAMAKRQRDLKMDLNIAKSLLDDGLITKAAFLDIQASVEEYDLQRRNFGEYIVRQTRSGVCGRASVQV